MVTEGSFWSCSTAIHREAVRFESLLLIDSALLYSALPGYFRVSRIQIQLVESLGAGQPIISSSATVRLYWRLHHQSIYQAVRWPCVVT